jgi:hypothetical protein
MQCRFKHVLTMLDPATATQAVKLILDRGLDAWVYNATPQIFRALLAAGHHDVVGHLGSMASDVNPAFSTRRYGRTRPCGHRHRVG